MTDPEDLEDDEAESCPDPRNEDDVFLQNEGEETDDLLERLTTIIKHPTLLELERRQLHGAAILEQPDRFKVCDGCEAVTLKSTEICDVCSGYNFDESAEKVRENTEILMHRPANSPDPDGEEF